MRILHRLLSFLLALVLAAATAGCVGVSRQPATEPQPNSQPALHMPWLHPRGVVMVQW